MIRVDPATVATAPAPTLIAGQLAMLTRLAEIGMEIAEAAGRRAQASLAAEAEPAGADPGLAFTRVARAVRQTLALQSQLMKDLAAVEREAGHVRFSEAGARKRRMQRILGEAIHAEHGGDFEIRHLTRQVRERLGDPDEYGDVLARPVAETMARICRDLGLSPDWSVRVAEYWEAEGWAPEGWDGPQGRSPGFPGRPPPRPSPEVCGSGAAAADARFSPRSGSP
jgi:hypothetical protein